MDLDELPVGIVGALLVQSGLRRSRADHRVGGFAENGANPARRNDHRVGRERANFHGPQINGANAATGTVRIDDRGQKLPVLVLLHFAFGFVPAHLLVERVKKLLAGGGPSERGAVVQSSAKAAEIEQTFGRAIKRYANA